MDGPHPSQLQWILQRFCANPGEHRHHEAPTRAEILAEIKRRGQV